MNNKMLLRMCIITILLSICTSIVTSCSPKKEEIVPSYGTISAGYDHTIALKKDGTVVATGSNKYGQCDVDDWSDIVQVSAGEYYSLGLKKDGTVVAVGDKSLKWSFTDWKDIISISAGAYYAVGLKKDGTIVTTYDGYRETYIDSYKDIKYIDIANSTVILINEEGKILNAIRDQYTEKRTKAFIEKYDNPISAQTTLALNAVLKDNGQLVLNSPRPLINIGNKTYHNIAQFDMDYLLICMLTKYGEVKIVKYQGSWFYMKKYEDEVKSWENIISVDAGADHVIALTSHGTVLSIGENDFGQCDVNEWTDIATERLPMDMP